MKLLAAFLLSSFFLLTSALECLAETFMWEDANGTHFTDNADSIPKKYRAKALAEARGDITTVDPDVAASVNRNRLVTRQRQVQEQAAQELAERQELARKRAVAKAEKEQEEKERQRHAQWQLDEIQRGVDAASMQRILSGKGW